MVVRKGIGPDEICFFGNLNKVSPEEFEELVRLWLITHGSGNLEDFKVQHLRKVQGAGGEYEIDVTAEFTVFGGARILTLVECKHQREPVKRDQVLVLEAKLRDTGGHKGVIFSTSSFQRGAVEYARTRGIATVTVKDGVAKYRTYSVEPQSFAC
jgi:restriction system protein